jgi:hypothetical protein
MATFRATTVSARLPHGNIRVLLCALWWFKGITCRTRDGVVERGEREPLPRDGS